jgi:xanthine dehydrogenase accessory factor
MSTSHSPVSTASDVLALLDAGLARDGCVALATIIETWGSAPVPVGGQMAITADGSFAGSVSGGCVEGEVITEAVELLEGGPPRTLSFGVEDETAWRVGLPCGGKIRVFVERLAGDAGRTYISALIEARSNRDALIVRTRLGDGVRQIVRRDDAAAESEFGRRFLSGISNFDVGPDGETFVHARLPPPRIVIIGATHIAQVLAEMVRLSGFAPIVVDPRTAFAADERFPGVELITDWPQDALPKLKLDPYTAVAALAHVGHIDDEALKLACRAECFYIGALGSRKNHAKRIERLVSAGLTPVEIGRIRSPIGLDLGATTPPEIALAVMAEILRHLRGVKGKGAA